jgi:hypothetical protein
MQLRHLNVHDVNIHPISNLSDVLDGYLEFHESGGADAYNSGVEAFVARAAAGYPQQ